MKIPFSTFYHQTGLETRSLYAMTNISPRIAMSLFCRAWPVEIDDIASLKQDETGEEWTIEVHVSIAPGTHAINSEPV